jgi:phage/plasmid-like protein (TIGR03299 family)
MRALTMGRLSIQVRNNMGRIVSNRIQDKGHSYSSTREALDANGLAWTVTKRPLFARIPNPGDEEHGIFKRADNLYGIVRDDNKATLGVASSRYQVVQTVEAFGPLDVLAAEGQVRILGTGDFEGGAKVWMQAAVPPVRIGGERVDYSVIAMLAHDGKGSVNYFDMAVRFFCTNQLRAIRRDAKDVKITIRHTASATDRVKEAHEIIRRVYFNQQVFVKTAEELLAQTFTRAEFEALALRLVTPPDPSDPTTTTRSVNMWRERFDTLMQDAYGAPDLNDIRFTKWGAINAVADFEQHHVRVKGTNEQRAETLLKRAFDDGPLAQRAFALITDH